MVDIHITVDDHGLSSSLKEKAGRLSSESQKLLKDLTYIAERWVKDSAPVKTGKLRGSIKGQVSGRTGSVFVPAGSVKYFDFVIDGTRPHDIVPKNRQALYWPGARHPVKMVRHPGTKPNPFFDKAVTRMEGEFERKLQEFAEWLGDL